METRPTQQILFSDLQIFLEKATADTPAITLGHLAGSTNVKFTQILPPEEVAEGCLCMVAEEKLLPAVLSQKPAVVILKFKADPKTIPQGITAFQTPDFATTLLKILQFFDRKKNRFSKGIHPTASVASTAQIGKNASIGAYAVVGENAVIGDDVILAPHTVVESLAQVGQGTILHSFVFIGSECLVGKNCEIHSHTTIGSDGFGFQKKKTFNHKIPQIGKVIIEDHVEIGANCAIDRATMTATIIGESSKLDNHCHIAHNCKIGKRALIAGGFMTAGSTIIGDDFMCGGNVILADHITVTNGVTMAGMSASTNDITEPGAYSGFPLEPFKEGLRTLANFRKLTSMRQDIASLKKALNLSDNVKSGTQEDR